MERASKLIRSLRLPRDTFSPAEIVCAAWPAAVGKKIASHTRAAHMVRTRLVIEVEDRLWQRQLFALTSHILRNFEKSLGPGLVEDLEFRIVPRRREPQRAETSVPDLFDEAESIDDPVLRGIYRSSRNKALA
ncbi:MAG TPA: DUF721 domain-containing protein [Bryobacteraceae bacterium]|nr:DUF721 domain-containing protein [Bryobacteraceae bacterium]